MRQKIITIVVLICFLSMVLPINVFALTCGADIDSDGFTDGPDEVAECVSFPVHGGQGDADFCSVEATDCVRPEPTEPIKVCLDPGYTYIATTDRCEKTPECPMGTWNAITGECDVPPTCSAQVDGSSTTIYGFTTYPLGECSTLPNGKCQVARTVTDYGEFGRGYAVFDRSCNWVLYRYEYSSGEVSESNMANVLPLAPGQQSQPATYPMWTYANNSILHPNSVDPDCNGGQYDAADEVCTTAFTLSHECVIGNYNPSTGMCESDTFNCPLGSYTCFDTGGVAPQCSPNPCVDVLDPVNDEILPPPDDSWYQDDGVIDDAGNCTGKMYIFSGKSSRCRPPGLQVGELNNCCDSDGEVSDSKTGSKYSSYFSALKTTYQMAKTAYYSYQIGTGAMTAVSAGGTVTVSTTAGATVTTMAASSEVGAGVVAAQGAAEGGAGAAGATTAGLEGFTSALFNPATIAFAIIVMVVIKVLFGSGCDQNDVQTAILNDSGYCHYLGDMCVKKNSILGCIQRAKRFCCFNSKMARIVAEQGRPQLKSFIPDGDWGTPEHPNCRGFTPEEFQQLDFSKIDLSEYFTDIMEGMEQNIQDAEQRLEQGVRRHYEATQ